MTTAAEYLEKASAVIKSRREGDYGDPAGPAVRIALLWNAYLEFAPRPLCAHQVHQMLLLMKIARSDSENDLIDAIGYAACVAEVHSLEQAPDAQEYEDFGDCCDFGVGY